MKQRYLRQLPKALLINLALCLTLTAPAAAVDSGGIGGKPANPRPDNPRTESIFVYELQPGAHVSDAVKVINNTESIKTLLVYAVDSQVSSGGAFACAQKVDTAVSVGSWLKLAKNQVTLQPNSSENVEFVLNVPKTASAGESNGCIVIQDAQQVPVQQGDGITLSFRTALRVAVTIPGEITKGLNFTNLVVTNPEGNALRMTAGLKNAGNVSLDTSLDVRVKSLFGTTVQKAGGQYPVLANSEASFNFEVPKSFWGGWYTAQAAASFNPDLASSLGEAGSTKTIKSQAVRFFVAPKPAALAIELAVAIVVAGVIFYALKACRHVRRLHASSKEFVIEKGDTLQSLAEEYDVPWKDIARINKLKPPYHLKPKDRIKIPLK